MEAALPSVVGGYVPCPVIAVPTSVGYGASLNGITAMLAMLTCCASNVVVVNIDAGFKGGYVAGLIASRLNPCPTPLGQPSGVFTKPRVPAFGATLGFGIKPRWGKNAIRQQRYAVNRKCSADGGLRRNTATRLHSTAQGRVSAPWETVAVCQIPQRGLTTDDCPSPFCGIHSTCSRNSNARLHQALGSILAGAKKASRWQCHAQNAEPFLRLHRLAAPPGRNTVNLQTSF